MYVDQKPTKAGNVPDPNGSVGDLSEERASQVGFAVHDTIAGALRCGGSTLAVDAVLIIGEHGEYPFNELGQHLLPRYEFFKEVTAVFRADGRTCPVFNDKHLSWNWDWAREMVAESRELGFALGAGSSTPSNFRMPAVDLPLGTPVEEVMAMGPGWLDGGDLHILEILQAVAERRRGGESGVKWVEALRGERAWTAHLAGSWEHGGWSAELYEACLCRSHTVAQVRRGFNHVLPTQEETRRILFGEETASARTAGKPTDSPQHTRDPVAYRWEYTDGTRGSLLLFAPLTADWTVAVQRGDNAPDPLLSFLCHSTPGPNNVYSAIHMAQAEQVFLTKDTSFRPIERTLLTSGIVTAAMHSLSSGKRESLPGLESISYAAPAHSTFENQ